MRYQLRYIRVSLRLNFVRPLRCKTLVHECEQTQIA